MNSWRICWGFRFSLLCPSFNWERKCFELPAVNDSFDRILGVVVPVLMCQQLQISVKIGLTLKDFCGFDGLV